MTLRALVLVLLLTALPVAASGVAVVGTIVSDNGDDDGYADTQETVTLRLVIRNTSGLDLAGLTARLTTTDGALACLTQSVIDIGAMAPDEERTTGEGFVFVVPPDVERVTVAEELSARFALSIRSSTAELLGELATTPWIDLDLDLDVSGGSGPTTYFESFEDGFGSFTTMHIDESLNPPDSDLANRVAGVLNADGTRCQYRNPDLFPEQTSGSQGLQCFPNPNGAPDAFYFGIVTDRAFTGTQSMSFNVFLDEARGSTTPNSQMEAVGSIDPVNLAWDGASPRLSFKHQVSFLDHRSVNAQAGRSADRGVVGVQLADNDGTATGVWIKAYPFVNVYDSMANSNYFNCSFDPIDDGNDEDDYFDPTDPDRSQGPSSTCAPEFTFAHQGDTDEPFDLQNVGDADPASGVEGAWGTGTWVEPVVDLSRFRGRRIRVRFLTSGMKLGGAVNWQQAFQHNPDPGDDGWFIDDITVTGALTTAATVAPDTKDNSALPPLLGIDTDMDGIFDVCDNCAAGDNPDQDDRDRDGIGDACDACPDVVDDGIESDVDGDGIVDGCDNCSEVANADQADSESDGIGDACDGCPDDPGNDVDGDGTCDPDDNCPFTANADQADADDDGKGDVCDNCPADPNPTQGRDEDEDGVDCPVDNCILVPNAGQIDDDRDGLGDACDPCLGDPTNDVDGDSVCGLQDSCPTASNPSQGLGLQLLSEAKSVFLLSPDETLGVAPTAFRSLPLGLDHRRLSSVPVTGGEIVALTGTEPHDFAITADSSTVVFSTGLLFSVPIRGGTVTRLGLDVSEGGVYDFELSPDGTRVVYELQLDLGGGALADGIVSVSPQGGASTILSLPAIDGSKSQGVRISSDSSRVLYIRDPAYVYAGEFDELYSVVIDDPTPVRLTPTLAPGGEIGAYEFTPDGSAVVYTADQDQVGVVELYSVPANGSEPPIKISGLLVSGGSVGGAEPGEPRFRISPDGSRVVYTADQEIDNRFELFEVPITGGTPTKLNDPLVVGADVLLYDFTPDGSRVVFTVQSLSPNRQDLFVVPFDGSPPSLLASAGVSEILRPILVTPNGNHVVYRRHYRFTGNLDGVYAAPIDGGVAVPLSDEATFEIDADVQLSGDGSRVAYKALEQDVHPFMWRLYNVPIEGGPRTELNDGHSVDPSLSPFALSHDGSVAYWHTEGLLYASWLNHDLDADGIHAACDCDGGDASIYPAAPEINDGVDNQCPGDEGSGLVDELGSRAFFDGADSYSWPPQAGAAEYEVVRAADAAFTMDCVCRSTRNSTVFVPEQPVSGAAFFYLPRTLTPNLGSAGVDSSGTERSGTCLTTVCGPAGP